MIQKGKKSNYRIFELRLEIFFNGTVVEYNNPPSYRLRWWCKMEFIITSGIYFSIEIVECVESFEMF